MNRYLLLFLLLFAASPCLAQDILLKYIDGDRRADTVLLDRVSARIVCRLSTQQYKPQYSLPIAELNAAAGVDTASGGFSFHNAWTRAGYSCRFRYNKKTGKMDLTGMNRYELGNVFQDGSGESSVNLLTGNYTGNWGYFDEQKQELINIPEINSNMRFPKTTLEQFSNEQPDDYTSRCAELYEKHKEAMIRKR